MQPLAVLQVPVSLDGMVNIETVDKEHDSVQLEPQVRRKLLDESPIPAYNRCIPHRGAKAPWPPGALWPRVFCFYSAVCNLRDAIRLKVNRSQIPPAGPRQSLLGCWVV